MYRYKKPNRTKMNTNKDYEGEAIEAKIRRIVNNKEPITDGAPLIYTDRRDGVQPGYDIRTDRFEVAIDAMDKVTKSHIAKREERQKAKDNMDKEDKTVTKMEVKTEIKGGESGT